ncbi:hypothetical protein EG19_07790 [Thermoanaerobaculum aquaticum]|uniref:Glycosyltransferase 2-like domain-containing protein n=2 Tax=Thermoanaerobaculum aquaticum TaxID=1312852 RepID=A0A062XKM0_9BACT|nr:hypothetical protein EG19_07790 [Thermoanaerobaculum aquaticum]
MDSLPTISVITPSYNKGEFLEQCILSVLQQEYPHVQYIIIDGGSTDNSVAIIRKYESQLAFWVSEPDHGQSHAINKGFAHATGDLVAWLNADDFYLPGAFSTVAQIYTHNPNASFYFGDGYRVDIHGRPIRAFFPPGTHTFNREALLFGLNYIMQQATFINRRFLVEIKGLNTDLHYGLDTDLWIRLSASAPPEPVPAKLAAIREYEDTKSIQGGFPRVEELRRIAELHSGLPITPGVLCYFLDTLHRYSRQLPETFPPSFLNELERFWASTAQLLWQYGARPDGFPETPAPPPATLPPPSKHKWLSLLRRFLWWRKRRAIS